MSKLLIGNAKGPKGDTGPKGEKGDKGNTGQRGSRWTSGTGITGTSTVGTKFPNSGITDAHLFDYYVNTDTGNLYECTVQGTAGVAEWTYAGNFKGPKGDTGQTGSISDINNQKPTYSEASKLENIESGETVKVAFGKLKKAISVLISHYTQKATQSILGHVRLSDSAAITAAGEYALDAIEKNASIDGTLANMIGRVNSNLASKSHGGIQWGGSCNDLSFGVYLTSPGTRDTPEQELDYWYMVISAYQDGTGVQVAIPLINSPKLYLRVCSAGNWIDWMLK